MAGFQAATRTVCTDNINDAMKCRFYENVFPEPDEFIIVRTTHIGEIGAYAAMLEYDNMEGMMMYAQIGRRRVRSMSGYFKVGRMEVVRVIRVDKEKGYIDLTRREIENEDRVKCVERYNKAVAVRDVLSHVAKRNNMRLEDLCTKVGWPLYAKFGHAYDAFQRVLNTTVEEEPTDIFADLNVSTELKEDLIIQIMEMDHEPASVKLTTEVFSDDSEAVTVVENDTVE